LHKNIGHIKRKHQHVYIFESHKQRYVTL